jgi:hypothetical protein
MRTDEPGAAARTKKRIRMCQVPNQLLCFANLLAGIFGIWLFTQRDRVCKSMVANPVALRVRPDRQLPATRFREFIANDKERGANAAGGQNVKHTLGDARRRPVVEREC